MNNKIRIFAAFFAGNMAFFFIYAFILWALTALKVSPYGRFMATFFKGRTSDEAKAFIAANQGLFDRMLPEASRFSNLFITPGVGLVMGVITGLIISAKNIKAGIIWPVVLTLPVAILFWTRSAGEPNRVFYFILLLALSGVGGLIGTLISSKYFQEKKDAAVE
ncbi:MAG: hypothetical protein HY893_07130 [Deltaproteobacteria bacterium]|nr:hypothetical protein [Deltaproteobacteria bacterium]